MHRECNDLDFSDGIARNTEREYFEVQKYPHSIRYISYKSIPLQMCAVQQNGFAIFWIKNPCEMVQFAAISQNLEAFKNIQYPTESVCTYMRLSQ